MSNQSFKFFKNTYSFIYPANTSHILANNCIVLPLKEQRNLRIFYNYIFSITNVNKCSLYKPVKHDPAHADSTYVAKATAFKIRVFG